MSDNRLVQDAFVCNQQMAISEKYESFVRYAYNFTVNLPRKHAVIRDLFMTALLEQARLFYEAGKTAQVSKLHVADAGMALLRFHLRLMVDDPLAIITKTQHRTASILLAEVGKMTGAWIKSKESKKG